MNAMPLHRWRSMVPVRIVRARPRLFTSSLFGVTVIVLPPAV
jgi:hypothetical protein